MHWQMHKYKKLNT